MIYVLIEGLCKMEEKNNKIPRVFISYSWTSDEYKRYVADLVYSLRNRGVDTVFDSYDLLPGNDKYVFMEQIVNDPDIDKVLILCDKGYKEKADKRTGGVGDETFIITPEVYGKVKQNKFIPVVMERGNNNESYIPAYLKSLMYVDMTEATGFDNLLRAIYGMPEYEKPPLGNPPAFVTTGIKRKVYKCAVCGKEIKGEGLLVKLQKPYGKVLHVVSIHKGECDDKLEAIGRRLDINTTSCMEMSFFDNDADIEAYINNEYSMSDSEFYIKYFNADGTLKK